MVKQNKLKTTINFKYINDYIRLKISGKVWKKIYKWSFSVGTYKNMSTFNIKLWIKNWNKLKIM